MFVYASPWSTHDNFEHLMVGVGDAFVYRPEKCRVHTLERDAFEKNYTDHL